MLLRLAARPSLFGLAPGGVYPAAPVARGAVRSCRPVSPLPAGCLAAPCAGGLFSVALSLGSPPPGVIRHRIPVEPGLSSTACAAAAVRPSGWQQMCGWERESKGSHGGHRDHTATEKSENGASSNARIIPARWLSVCSRWPPCEPSLSLG